MVVRTALVAVFVRVICAVGIAAPVGSLIRPVTSPNVCPNEGTAHMAASMAEDSVRPLNLFCMIHLPILWAWHGRDESHPSVPTQVHEEFRRKRFRPQHGIVTRHFDVG